MILKNVNAVTPNGVICTDIEIENGLIKKIGKTQKDGIDFAGKYAFPGFVDTHIHGAFGTEFASENEEFDKGLVKEAEMGITSVCATVRCLPLDDTHKAIKNIVKEYKRQPKGASIRGIHLEGPFVSPKYIGSMNPSWLSLPSPDEMKRLYDSSEGLLKIITIAPELENAIETIKTAVSLGVTVSIGHSAADYDTALRAYETGARQITHTFNAAVPFHHRSPGLLGFGLTEEGMKCEAICDLVHLDKAAIKLIYLAKGDDRINMISDSGVFSGLGDGEYIIAGKKRTVKNGVCTVEGGRIAGSCYTLHQGVKNLLSLGYSPVSVSKMSSLNPSETLGIDDIAGSLEEGKRADIAILDGNYDTVMTFIGGETYEQAHRG